MMVVFDWDRLNTWSKFLFNDNIYRSYSLPYPKRSRKIKNKRRRLKHGRK